MCALLAIALTKNAMIAKKSIGAAHSPLICLAPAPAPSSPKIQIGSHPPWDNPNSAICRALPAFCCGILTFEVRVFTKQSFFVRVLW
jgi:hypothetical protein